MTPAQTFEPTLSGHAARMDALHENQVRQDSALTRVDDKFEALRRDIFHVLLVALGSLVTGIGSLAAVLLKR